VAYLTNTKRPIGVPICDELDRDCVNVCLVARDQAKLNEVASSITPAAFARTVTREADLPMPEFATAAMAATVAAFGGLDILVNNADRPAGGLFSLSDDDWHDGFSSRFHGYVRMTRSVRPYLPRARRSVVNVVGSGLRVGSSGLRSGGGERGHCRVSPRRWRISRSVKACGSVHQFPTGQDRPFHR
jgi:NAD(P)-dependent dehydrogenase (short-subunit alcohol dehydrogenase family)